MLFGEGYLTILESLFEIGTSLKPIFKEILELRYWWLFKIIIEEVA